MKTQFVCGLSGRLYKTARGARESEKREALIKERKDYLVNNVSDLGSFETLLIQKSKEFYDWDLHIHKFERVRLEEIQSTAVGLRFRMEFNMFLGEKSKRVGKHKFVLEHLCEGFTGLKSCWTSWATFKSQQSSGCSITGDMILEFKHFKLIEKNYHEYLVLAEKEKKYLVERNKVVNESSYFAESLEEHQKQKKEVVRLNALLNAANCKLNEIKRHHSEKYVDLWKNSVEPKPEIDYELVRMFKGS